MISSVKVFNDYFINGQIPDKNNYENLLSDFNEIIKNNNSKKYDVEPKTIQELFEFYKKIPLPLQSSSGQSFSHFLNLFELYLLDYSKTIADNGDVDDNLLVSFIEQLSSNDDFSSFIEKYKKKEDFSSMGSIDRMLMGLSEKDYSTSNFGFSFDNEISYSFENSILKEKGSIDKNFSCSLIELDSGYIRANILCNIDDGKYLRFVYSYEPISGKIGINIYHLDEQGSLISCKNDLTYSILMFISVEGHSFIRTISPKKEGSDFINSSLYSVNNEIKKIAKSLSSVCVMKDDIGFFTEPHLKSFDFFDDKFELDRINNILVTERDSFLFSGNKGRKKSGTVTNKSVLGLMPPNFFGLTEFSTLEIERILLNSKDPLEFNNFDAIDLDKTIDIEKEIGGFYMALDNLDMLDCFDYSINPFFGKKFLKEGYGIEQTSGEKYGYCFYKTTFLDIETIKPDEFLFKLNIPNYGYFIEDINFYDRKKNKEKKLLAKVYVKDLSKKSVSTMGLIDLQINVLQKYMEQFESEHHEMDYFIVDLRKFNKKILKSILDLELKELNKDDFKINNIDEDDYSVCYTDVTDEYQSNPVLNMVKNKANVKNISVLRVTFTSLKYLKNFKETESFNSYKMCKMFCERLNKDESESTYITSTLYKGGYNTVDFIVDNDKIDKLKK